MASYGYANHGYATSNDVDNQRYGGGHTYSDNLWKPAILDGEGHRQPKIRYTPDESYVVERETIVKHVRMPIDEYKNHDDKWRRPSSPIHDRNNPHTMVEHYGYGSGSPTKYKYGSSSPTKYEVDNIDKWHTPRYDRPHQVEEFITKVQTEASQPRINPLTGSYLHNSAKPTSHTGSSGYEGWNKSSDDWSRSDQWTKPTGRPLGGPTSDINEAVHFLKEAAKLSSIITTGAPNSRYTEPMSGYSKKDGYMETVDNSEARRQYARPTTFKPFESYNGTINNRDASGKYRGAFVP